MARLAKRALKPRSRRMAATPNIRTVNGGRPHANWMVRHGIPTAATFAPANEPHTVDEWIDLAEYEKACALALGGSPQWKCRRAFR